MKTTRRRRIVLDDDSGAVLILALVIVTVVAVVVTALLSFTDTSLRTTVQLRQQATTAATADGAAQVAINTLRRGTYNNDIGQQCFGTTDTLQLDNFLPSAPGAAGYDSAAVRCGADPATGATGVLVPITQSNKPGNAILTLSTNPAEDGINVKALHSNLPFNVHGGIVSDSNINVSNGSLQSTTEVYAHTGCTGTIVAPVLNCASGTAADPGYSPETTTVPQYQPVPQNVAANCPGKVVTFEPGYYDDAAALSDMMSGNGACKHSVWWFKPGVYYFDFQNSAGTVPGVTGTDQWLVKDGQLIAGTPTDAAGTVLTAAQLQAAAKPMAVPGACESPIHSTTAVGVQFIFGGDSQLQIAGSGDAEICSSYHANRPPIAVYGLKSGTTTPATTNGLAATTVTGAGFTATAGATLASALTAANDGKADTWTATKNNDSATLTLAPFLTGPGIPAGSTLSSAKLRIVYGGSDAAADRTVTVTPSSASGPGSALSPVDVPNKKSAQPNGTTQTVDLTAGLASGVHDKGLTGLSVAYATTMSKPAKEVIDAVFLDLTYTVPTFRGETTAAVPGNCLATAYTGGSGGQCAVLSTTSSYSGNFYIQGTTYAPIAPIDITLSNITEQVLRFGVVSRTLMLKETGSVGYIGPVIEIPDDALGYGPGGTVVWLEVFVCSAPSCSVSTGTRALTARVFIHDPNGTPVAGKREMTIQSWSVLRR